MYYTDDSLYPENMQPLIITVAPYGPSWIPGDADIPVTLWKEQVQAAIDCQNAGSNLGRWLPTPQKRQVSQVFRTT